MSASSLSAEQRAAAVTLFEAGHGRQGVAHRLGVRSPAIRALHDRWRLRGAGALVMTPTKRTFSFECKREIVQRFLAGEPKLALAQAYDVSSPDLIKKWVRIYRTEGEDGLRPKPKGRPKRDADAPGGDESEVQRLRRENERLRAEVAYLGKLRALSAAERR
jgi:transposase-like protein